MVRLGDSQGVTGNRGYRQSGSSFGDTLLKVRHGVARLALLSL